MFDDKKWLLRCGSVIPPCHGKFLSIFPETSPLTWDPKGIHAQKRNSNDLIMISWSWMDIARWICTFSVFISTLLCVCVWKNVNRMDQRGHTSLIAAEGTSQSFKVPNNSSKQLSVCKIDQPFFHRWNWRLWQKQSKMKSGFFVFLPSTNSCGSHEKTYGTDIELSENLWKLAKHTYFFSDFFIILILFSPENCQSVSIVSSPISRLGSLTIVLQAPHRIQSWTCRWTLRNPWKLEILGRCTRPGKRWQFAIENGP